jgi:AcrR family transcriptional regulator
MTNIHQTKKSIRDALLDLMLTMDVDKIVVIDLTRKAGVSRATFYRYYGSVEDVLCEMEDEFFEGMRDCSRYYISAPFNVKSLDRPYPAFVAIAEYVYEYRHFFLSVTGLHGYDRFFFKWHKFVREFFIGKAAYEGLARKDLDVYVEFVLAGSDAVIRYWLAERSDISPKDIVPIIQKILYGPLVC